MVKRKTKGMKKVVRKGVVDSRSDDNYRNELLAVDNEEKKYDRLFEQKLSQQYQEFRSMKEHHLQSGKFLRLLFVILTIILLALLILTYG